jgi:hypothetical protein
MSSAPDPSRAADPPGPPQHGHFAARTEWEISEKDCYEKWNNGAYRPKRRHLFCQAPRLTEFLEKNWSPWAHGDQREVAAP